MSNMFFQNAGTQNTIGYSDFQKILIGIASTIHCICGAYPNQTSLFLLKSGFLGNESELRVLNSKTEIPKVWCADKQRSVKELGSQKVDNINISEQTKY
jgi:hypothetical protein